MTSRVDRHLSLSFGAVVLLLMLLVTSAASYLFLELQSKEEDRLSGALAVALSESISRISFSGKYHTRLLVEEMCAKVAELDYISVESTDGKVIAHSDPRRNDTVASPEGIARIRDSLQKKGPIIEEIRYQGRMVKEVVLPFQGGADSAVEGIVRLGINVEDARHAQKGNRLKLFLLITGLTVLAMGVVFVLSRHFGGSVRALATQLQGVLDHAPLGLSISDKTGRILAHSVEFERLFGKPKPNQAVDTFLTQTLSDADVRRLREIDCEILRTGAKIQEELSVQLRGKACHWSLSKFAIARDNHQQVTLICTFIRDVTERQQALEALRESEEAFRRLFEKSSDAILLIKDARFIECNQAALNVLGGIQKTSLVGALPGEISPERQTDGRLSVEAAREHYEIACRDGYDRFDWICRRADGSLVDLDVAATRIVIKGETMLHITWRDITERKQAELERQKLQSQLLQAQKMESVGRLAGGVAHDFNNMLQAILGNTCLALEELPADSPLRENLEEIQKSAERSANLTQQLLAFARRQAVSPTALNLNEIVEGMLKMLRRIIGEDVQLCWQPGTDLWSVKVDPSQVDQVLANLCVNARDAIAGVGKVVISTENSVVDADFCAARGGGSVPGEYVLLTVSDTGSGMDHEVLTHLFEPFYTTKGLGKGTGLGLATVYGIVSQNKGFIQVSSEPGQGAVFKIYLPRYEGSPDQSQTPIAKKSLCRGNETILIVEDETAILKIARQVLENLGYTVLSASSPIDAVRMVKEYSLVIHLLITDVVMPEMNGRDLAAQLQAICPALGCLFISGYTADIIARNGVLEQGVHFIQKPFSSAELSEKVRVALGNRVGLAK